MCGFFCFLLEVGVLFGLLDILLESGSTDSFGIFYMDCDSRNELCFRKVVFAAGNL